MADDPKKHDGESTPEEIIEIHQGIDQTSTKEEAEELTEKFGDENETAA